MDNRGVDEGLVIERLRHGYDAWNRGDIEAGLEFAAEDMEWHGPPDSPFAGPHMGHAQIRAFAHGMLEMFARIERTPQGFEIHGDHVLVPVQSFVRGTGSGIEVEVSLVDVWTIREGLVARYAVFPDRGEALAYIACGEHASEPAPAG